MPSTYNFGLQDYFSGVQYLEGADGKYKSLYTPAQRKAFINEANAKIHINNNLIQEIKESKTLSDGQKRAKLEALLAENDQLNSYKKLLNHIKPEDLSHSLYKGWVQSFWENFSELAVGPLFDKVTGKIKIKTPKILKENILAKTYKRGANFINKLSREAFDHLEGPGILQSLPGEMFEEIAVQFAPQVDMNWEDYKKQTKELLDPHWWIDTGASVPLIGLITGGPISTMHAMKYFTDKDYRDTLKHKKNRKKEVENILNELSKKGVKDEDIKRILMGTGSTYFNPTTIHGEISKLRNEGKLDEAAYIEKKSFTNLIIRALKAGSLDSLESTFKSMLENKDLSEKTKQTINELMPVLNDTKNFYNKFKDVVNFEDIAAVKGKQLYGAITSKELQKRIEKLKREYKPLWEQFAKKNKLEDITFDDVIDGKVDADVYKKMYKNNIAGLQEIAQLNFLKDLVDVSLADEVEVLTKQQISNVVEKAKTIFKNIKNKKVAESTTKETEKDNKKEIVNNKDATNTERAVEKAAKESEESAKTAPVKEKDNDIPESVREQLTDIHGNVLDLNLDDSDDFLYAPVEVNDKNKNFVDKLAEVIKESLKNNKDFTLENLIARSIDDIGSFKTLRAFNLLTEAWVQGSEESLSEDEKQALFNKFFGSDQLTEVLQALDKEIKDSEEKIEQSAEVVQEVVEELEKEETRDHGKYRYIEVEFEDRKINQPNLKLAFLGMDYEFDDEMIKRDKSKEVNEEAHPILYWGNFQPGDKVRLSFHWDYMTNPNNKIRLWIPSSVDINLNAPKFVVKKILKQYGLQDLYDDDVSYHFYDKESEKDSIRGTHSSKNTVLYRGVKSDLGPSIQFLRKDTSEVIVHELLHRKFNKKFETAKNKAKSISIWKAIKNVATKDTIKQKAITYSSKEYSAPTEDLIIHYLTSSDFRNNIPDIIKSKIENFIISENIMTKSEIDRYLSKDFSKEIDFVQEYLDSVKDNISYKPVRMTIKDFVIKELGMSWEEFEIKTMTPSGRKSLLENDKFLDNAITSIKINVDGKWHRVNAGINSPGWWNPVNVALPHDKKTGAPLYNIQQEIIEEARRYSRRTREVLRDNEDEEITLTVQTRRTASRNTTIEFDEKGRIKPIKYQSVNEAYKNNKEAASQYSTIVFFNGDQLSNMPDGKTIKLDNGETINIEQIENFREYVALLKEKELERKGVADVSGMLSFVYKSGNNRYRITGVNINHEDAQDKYTTQVKIIDEILRLSNIINKGSSNKEEVELASKLKSFLQTININLGSRESVIARIADNYPKKMKDGSRGGRYYQSISKSASNSFTLNLLKYNSVEEFLEDVREGNLESVKPQDILRENISVTPIFTEVKNVNGDSVWTDEVQPVIQFDNSHLGENEQAKQVDYDQTKKKVLDKLKEKIKDAETKEEKEVLENIAKGVEESIKEEEQAKIPITKTEQVIEEEDVPYEGTLEDIHDITDEIVFRALQFIDVTKDFKVSQIEGVLKRAFYDLYDEIKDSHPKEAEYLLKHKGSFIGTTPFKYSALNKINVLLDLDNTTDDTVYDEKSNFEAKDYERDIFKSISFKTKILLSGIKDNKVSANTTFPGINRYMSMTDVFSGLHQVLAGVNEVNEQEIKEKIEELYKTNPTDFKFLEEVFDKIFSLKDDKVKNEILYNVAMPKMDMKFVLLSGKNGNVVKKLDSNSKSPGIKTLRDWKVNFTNSNLVRRKEEGLYRINKEEAKKLTDLYKVIKEQYKDNNVDLDLVYSYLSSFGITLDPIVKKIIEDNYNTGSKYDVVGPELNLFDSASGLISLLQRNLESALKKQEKKDLAFEDRFVVTNNEIKFNLLVDNTSKALKKLVDLQVSLTFNPESSIYLAEKIVNAFQKPKLITNVIKKLKTKEGWIEATQTQINTNSLILKFLKESEEFKNYFDMSFMSLEAYSIAGSKFKKDTEPSSLSNDEMLMVAIAMLTHSDGKLLTTEEGFVFRKGSILFPALSDSGQVPMLNTAILDINKDNFDTKTNLVTPSVIELIFNTVVYPELQRISASKDVNVNVKGHNIGKKFIFSLPILNTIEVETTDKDGNKITRPLIDVLNNYSNKAGVAYSEDLQSFLNDYKEKMINEITAFVSKEVDKFIDELQTNKFINQSFTYTKYIDEKYLKSKVNKKKLTSSDNKKAVYMMANEFVVNNLLVQKEIQSLFASDPANFYKYKGKLEFGLPEVTVDDILNYYYPGVDVDVNKLSKEELLKNYPQLQAIAKYSDKLGLEERYEIIAPILKFKAIELYKDTQNNLSKRLKALISPGLQFPGLQDLFKEYTQIFVKDVVSSSEVIDYLADLYYSGNKNIKKLVTKYKVLNDKSNRTLEEDNTLQDLENKINKEAPLIAPYLKTDSTDAQEMATWSFGLTQLYAQGRINKQEYNYLYDKFVAQEKDLEKLGYIKKENLLTTEERMKFVMQPSKPLYSGNMYESVDDYNYNRWLVYIKTSSFYLLPEATQAFPKLEQLRKNVRKIEERDDKSRKVIKPVRLAFASGVKVGATDAMMSIHTLYDSNFKPDNDAFKNSSMTLSTDNFYIQLDKPYKFKDYLDKGEQSQVLRATQFEKILLGDGINKIKEKIFDIRDIDSSILESLNIKPVNNKVSGEELYDIYNELYRLEQEQLNNKILSKLGLRYNTDRITGSPIAMEKLIRLLKQRLTNPQDLEALQLTYYIRDDKGNEVKVSKMELNDISAVPYKAELLIPIWLLPNSQKFESVLNSFISKNNLKLKMPGSSGVSTSQEGFEVTDFSEDELEKLKKKGLITTKNFDGKLKATHTKDGKLIRAQVFMTNKFQYYDIKIGKFKRVDLENYVDENGVLNIPDDILELFSFRIPTSAHQSGVTVEVVGFLPENMGDLMVVPKDHTVQIGEDYDIDVRYYYNYNLIKDKEGNLKKINLNDSYAKEFYNEELDKAISEYRSARAKLFKDFFNVTTDPNGKISVRVKNPAWFHNRSILLEIAFLKKDLMEEEDPDIRREISIEIEKLKMDLFNTEELQTIKEETLAEYELTVNKLLKEVRDNKHNINSAYRKWKSFEEGIDYKLLGLQNNLLNIYNAVMTANDKRVQGLINKVLSTSRAENTAKLMEQKLHKVNNYISPYSYFTQRKIYKSGTEGKIGIGKHSNAVVINSLLQQSKYEHMIYKAYDAENNKYIPYNIQLGKFVFDGKLGRIKANNIRFSEVAMESQNVSTDNQKLGIMDRRNEDRNTMSVLQILQTVLPDLDGVKIKGREYSYSSLFINQPVIREFANLVPKYSSQLNDFYGNPFDEAYQEIQNILLGKISEKNKYFRTDEEGKLTTYLKENVKKEIGKELTSKGLYDFLLDDINGKLTTRKALRQYYILESFMQLRGVAKEYNKLVKLINMETPELGLSYFDVIEKSSDYVSRDLKVTNLDKLLGDVKYIETNKEYSEALGQGYKPVKRTGTGSIIMVKPTTFYAHKVVNTLSNAYNLYADLFPYENSLLSNTFKNIINISGAKSEKDILDLKYTIMSSMKDFMYNYVPVLRSYKDQIAERLFFDDIESGKQSLATYLQNLKNTEIGKKLFDREFFKDLEFEINDKTFPSIIKYIPTSRDPLRMQRAYNTLESLYSSNERLPDFNGEKYNYNRLIKDLFLYSLIANQQKGATGFRNIMPVKLFKEFKLDEISNNLLKGDNAIIARVMFEGNLKSITNFLGDDIEDGKILNMNSRKPEEVDKLVQEVNNSIYRRYGVKNALRMDKDGNVYLNRAVPEERTSVFVKQFFQHNPDFAARIGRLYKKKNGLYTDNLVHKIIVKNGYSVEDFENRKVPLLLITDKDITGKRKHISPSLQHKLKYRDIISIELSNGSKLLYEQISPNTYRYIPKLGTNTFNEYYPTKDVNRSRVDKNNLNTKLVVPTSILAKYHGATLAQVVNSLSKDSNSSYGAVFNLFKKFVNIKDIKVQVSESKDFRARYSPSEGIVYLQKDWLYQASKVEIEQVIAEEFLHVITKSLFDRYVEIKGMKDGKLLWNEKEGITVPEEINELLDIYNYAINYYYEKYGKDKLEELIKSSNSNIASYDQLVGYRLSNIHEFLAGLFIKNEEFAREMAKVKYRDKEESVLKGFVRAIVNLIKRILPEGALNDSVSMNAISALYRVVSRAQLDKSVIKPTTKEIESIDKEYFTEDRKDYNPNDYFYDVSVLQRLVKDKSNQVVNIERFGDVVYINKGLYRASDGLKIDELVTEEELKEIGRKLKENFENKDQNKPSKQSSMKGDSQVSNKEENVSEEEIQRIAEERWRNDVDERGYPRTALSEVVKEVRREFENNLKIKIT